jgi:hypothetical protein
MTNNAFVLFLFYVKQRLVEFFVLLTHPDFMRWVILWVGVLATSFIAIEALSHNDTSLAFVSGLGLATNLTLMSVSWGHTQNLRKLWAERAELNKMIQTLNEESDRRRMLN